jgi:CheY-like chemotaxis protein
MNLRRSSASDTNPGLAVFQDEVHDPQQERIGQTTPALHEHGERVVADAQALGQGFVAANNLGSSLEDFYASRAHGSSISRLRNPLLLRQSKKLGFRPASASAQKVLIRQTSAFGLPARDTDWLGNERPAALSGLAMATRVLLCDDNADAADTLRLLLESEGHEVSVCHAGLACIDKARRWQPHVVLVDIGLPDVSGYAVAREIRQMPFGHDVILVAYTGHGHPQDVRFGAAAGFDAHMTEGTDPMLLVELAARARDTRR